MIVLRGNDSTVVISFDFCEAGECARECGSWSKCKCRRVQSCAGGEKRSKRVGSVGFGSAAV